MLVVSIANQIVISYLQDIRLAGYIYQQPTCLELLGVVAWVNVSDLQKTMATRGIMGLSRFSLQHS